MVLFLDCDTGLMNIDNAIKILILFGKYHKQIKMVTL